MTQKSIFKQSTTDLNLEFSFPKESNLLYYLHIAEGASDKGVHIFSKSICSIYYLPKIGGVGQNIEDITIKIGIIFRDM